jgi:hypothetical protein
MSRLVAMARDVLSGRANGAGALTARARRASAGGVLIGIRPPTS